MSGQRASRLSPPAGEAPVADSGQYTQAWANYFDNVSQALAKLDAISSQGGVTDGSEATAGDVGEYLTASGSATLANGVAATVATLTLTAGDWDVSGYVTFTAAGAASNHYGVSIDGTPGGEFTATIPSGSGTQRLIAATVRRNVTADTAVALSALAGFSSGSVSAAGTISARRMR